MSQDTSLELRGISHWLGSALVLSRVEIAVAAGETVCLIGPSGCGKSTLLRIAAGLLLPDEGSVRLGATTISGRPGSVAYMPQDDLLLPWRSAARNVATPLEIQGASRSRALVEARDLLRAVGLGAASDSDPRTLSGGMRQRVAFVRTLVQGREAMLLDEPFGALDQLTRSSLHGWFRRTLRRRPAAVVIVTHDISEAVMLGDRVVVMTPQPGRVGAVINVDLPSDRDTDAADTAEFTAIERDVRRALAEHSSPSPSNCTSEVAT